jgi:hypothetical protein
VVTACAATAIAITTKNVASSVRAAWGFSGSVGALVVTYLFAAHSNDQGEQAGDDAEEDNEPHVYEFDSWDVGKLEKMYVVIGSVKLGELMI